jgi:hypothetical protein
MKRRRIVRKTELLRGGGWSSFRAKPFFGCLYIYSQKEKFKIQSGFGKFSVAIIRPKFKEKSPEFFYTCITR